VNTLKLSEKLIASVLVMITAIVVPYGGTCLAGLIFAAILYFPDIIEAASKFDEAANKRDR
jgi:hypothetical protein